MDTSHQGDENFFVVCIGASAGGLEALERFFKNCNPSLNAAFVVIQHLSSDYKSMMDDLINRYTDIQVNMIEDQMRVKPRNIYLIPAGTTIELAQGHFVVSQKQSKTLTLPIDIFLHSLAKQMGNRSIAVILSGTGSDGSRGATAINASGGFVIAQTPEDARFDGMPQNLINTGVVDEILPVTDIPRRIEKFIDNPILVSTHDCETAFEKVEQKITNIDAILGYLKQAHDVDFRDYKSATVSRRIERRMQVKHNRDFASYLKLLKTEPSEALALRRELLIPVTSFFRDEEVFETLRSEVIPRMIDAANSTDGIRVWVAGCSTGEEAYSMAMLLLWESLQCKKWIPIKVFATDVNPEAIETGALGRFPETIAAEIPPELLTRFFSKEDKEYLVSNELRQSIVFAKHNLLMDAPFTKMDLVSCRNTLIYFQNKAQTLALQKLQYACKVGAVMLLGKSETLSYGEHNFETLDSRLKIYRCVQRNTIDYVSSTLKNRTQSLAKHAGSDNNGMVKSSTAIQQAETLLFENYLPSALLLNDKNEVIHLYSDVSPYVQLKTGTVSYSMNQVLPDKLLPIASALLFRIKKEGKSVSSDQLLFQSIHNEDSFYIRLNGHPIYEAEQLTHTLLVIVRVDQQAVDPASESLNINSENAQRINLLEQELSATRESLQSTIEELETTNEELQATNEELMASNEELQSSNEELQSVNEELNTVNAEYHEKMNILNRINSDLDAMSRAVGIATIFLDARCNLTRFTPDALDVFKLRETDIGRPLEEIVHNLDYPEFFNDIERNLQTGRVIEKQVSGRNQRDYLVRMVNYNLSSQNDAGVVISFVDISAIKTSEQLQLVIDALPEHIAVVDRVGRIVKVNRAWDQFAQANGDEKLSVTSVGSNYLNVCNNGKADDSAQKASRGIKGVLEGSLNCFSLEYPCHSPTEQRWFAMEVVPVKHDVFAAVVSHFNISSWKLKMTD